MSQSIARLPSSTGRLAPPWTPLLAPSLVFEHPQHVVAAPDLTLDETRALLAAWASDASAVESAPGLRRCPGLLGQYVSVDAVLDALRSLDPAPARGASEPPTPTRRTRKQGVRWLTPRLSRVT